MRRRSLCLLWAAMTLPDGRSLSLLQARSASGACRDHVAESFVLRNKGGSASIEDKDRPVDRNCRRRRRA